MPLDSRRAAALDPRVVFDAHALQDFADAEAPLVGRVIVAGGLTLIRGEVGLGKSWLALSLAQAAAGGHALFGWRVKRPCRVLYVDGGLRLSALAARARIVAAGIGACAPRNLQVAAAARTPLPDLGSEDGLAALEAMLPEQLDLLVLDGVVAPLGAGRGATQRVQLLAAWIEVLAPARRRGAAHRRAAPRRDRGARRARRHGAGAGAALRLRARRGRAGRRALRRGARPVGAGGAALRGAAQHARRGGGVEQGRPVRRGGGAGGGAARGRAVLPRHRPAHGRAVHHRVPPAQAGGESRDRHFARNSGTARAWGALT